MSSCQRSICAARQSPGPGGVITASIANRPPNSFAGSRHGLRLTVRRWGGNVTRTVLRLVTFGGLGLESDDGSTPPRLRPARLALLAVLGAAGDRGASRERLAGLFWPEADDQHANHSLRQARYALRNDLDCEVIRSDGAVLSLDRSAIASDVAEFRAALGAHDAPGAVALARGPFLTASICPGHPSSSDGSRTSARASRPR